MQCTVTLLGQLPVSVGDDPSRHNDGNLDTVLMQREDLVTQIRICDLVDCNLLVVYVHMEREKMVVSEIHRMWDVEVAHCADVLKCSS